MGSRYGAAIAAAALAWSAPQAANAATMLGAPTLIATPAAGASCPRSAPSCTTVLTAPETLAKEAGVVVRWRVRAAPGAQELTLRAARADGAGWRAAATDPTPRRIAGGTIEEFPARMPLEAGDALAIQGPTVPAAVDPFAAGPLAVFTALGAVAAEPDATIAGGLLLQADVEPDADADGYGDESQDRCPAEQARQASPCTAALSAAVSAPEWGVVGEPVQHRYTVAGGGPSAAEGVSALVTVAPGARLLGIASSRGSCDAGDCAVGVVPSDESAVITVTLSGDAPGEVRSAISVRTSSIDSVTSDDATAATTTLTLPSVAPPPTVLPAPACANVRIGTNDDELLEGSSFGDRLVGRGGRDLIRGFSGDDCLEGGRGGDVLGGGAGRDRLSGGFSPDRLYGDTGDDRLEAGNGDDSLAGGEGNDQLFPGPGADQVSGGRGNDTISARDRTRDRIDCGLGRDSARVDRLDVVRGCESVSRA